MPIVRNFLMITKVWAFGPSVVYCTDSRCGRSIKINDRPKGDDRWGCILDHWPFKPGNQPRVMDRNCSHLIRWFSELNSLFGVTECSSVEPNSESNSLDVWPFMISKYEIPPHPIPTLRVHFEAERINLKYLLTYIIKYLYSNRNARKGHLWISVSIKLKNTLRGWKNGKSIVGRRDTCEPGERAEQTSAVSHTFFSLRIREHFYVSLRTFIYFELLPPEDFQFQCRI